MDCEPRECRQHLLAQVIQIFSWVCSLQLMQSKKDSCCVLVQSKVCMNFHTG